MHMPTNTKWERWKIVSQIPLNALEMSDGEQSESNLETMHLFRKHQHSNQISHNNQPTAYWPRWKQILHNL